MSILQQPAIHYRVEAGGSFGPEQHARQTAFSIFRVAGGRCRILTVWVSVPIATVNKHDGFVLG